MKAYRMVKWQTPPEFQELPIPEPGPGQIRLKVAANGICGSDLHLMEEWTASPAHINVQLPMTIGHEPAGWVDKLGSGVSGFEIGEGVIVTTSGCGRCKYCAEGWNNYCMHKPDQVGMGLDGALAEYVIAPAASLVPVNIDLVEAAPLSDAGLSSFHAVKRVAPLLHGASRVAVIGIGGLGHMAVQELKAITGAHITVFARSESSHELAYELGADDARFSDVDHADKMSMDAVLDFVGNPATMQLAIHMIKPMGHIVVSGRSPKTMPFGSATMPYGATLSTTFGGSKSELMELIGLVEKGLVKAHVTRFSLDEVEKAFRLLKEGKIHGRAVIIP